MKKHYRQENDCLNCGATLQGKFCHVCGQENLEIHENFGHMMNHVISDYFHFDHLFFHTLKPLLFKPGKLPTEYMAGRRVQYLHPVKMYIFISIVYFLLLFQSSHESAPVATPQAKQPAATQKPISHIDSSGLALINKDIDQDHDLNAHQKAAVKKGLAKAKVISDYGIVKLTEDEDDRGPNSWFHPIAKDTSYSLYLANQKKMPEDERDNFIVRQWNKKTYNYLKRYGPVAKDVFVDELRHNTPKMMFLLLPLFALILRVAFWKNRKFYVEHMIYSLHLHCFLFLFLGIVMLIQTLIPTNWSAVNSWLTFLTVIYIAWYSYRSLRLVYQRGRFRTISKMIGVGLMYFLAFSFCLTVIVLATALI